MEIHRENFVTKEDASKLQSVAAKAGEGYVPKESFVFHVQAAADKNANLTRGMTPITLDQALQEAPPTSEEVRLLQSTQMKEEGKVPIASIVAEVQGYVDKQQHAANTTRP